MIPLVADNKDAIVALCRQYGVRRRALWLRGLTGAFDPERTCQTLLRSCARHSSRRTARIAASRKPSPLRKYPRSVPS